MSSQDTAQRLDAVRIHLHNAMEELGDDNSEDARYVRRAVSAAQRTVGQMRRQRPGWFGLEGGARR